MAGQRRKSKKRSGASSPSIPPPPQPPKRIYEFIVDECVSQRHVPEALNAAGHTVYLLPAVFGTGAQDPDWLPSVGERGWVLITKDKNIRKRPIEMRAHMGTNVRSFVFTAGNMTGEQQGQLLRRALPKIIRILKKTPAPFIAHIRASAEVAVLDLERYLGDGSLA